VLHRRTHARDGRGRSLVELLDQGGDLLAVLALPEQKRPILAL
jgi:hypothetical protein